MTKLIKSFGYAWSGVYHAYNDHPNFKIHLTLALLAVVFGIFYGLNSIEWAIIILTIAVGLVIELLNTSIENVVDLITKEQRLNAKLAKDTAAAAMLIYSLGAALAALVIFLPKI